MQGSGATGTINGVGVPRPLLTGASSVQTCCSHSLASAPRTLSVFWTPTRQPNRQQAGAPRNMISARAPSVKVVKASRFRLC